MTRQAHLADGTILEFPAETSDEVMDRAVKSHMFPAKPTGNGERNKRMAYGGGPAVAAEDFGRAALNQGRRLAMGAGQLIHSGVTAAADAFLSPDNPVRQWADSVHEKGPQVLAQQEADYQAQVPDNAASYAGATVGAIAPWMVGIGELRALGMLPKIGAAAPGVRGTMANLAKKGGLLAGEGALMGATTPVEGEGSFAGQKATQVGVGAAAAPILAGSLNLGGKAATGLANLARYATPAGQDTIANARLARLYPNASPEQLRADSGVRGYQLTPAQSNPTPENIQAERVLRNNGQTAPAFAAQESANNLALRNQVAGVAGTDAEMQAAAQARREGPGAFWKENMATGAENGRYGRAAAHIAEYQGSRQMLRSEFDILDQARKIAGQVQRGSVSQAEGDAAIRQLAPKSPRAQKALDQALGIIDKGMVNPSRVLAHLNELAKDTNPTIAGAANSAIAGIAKNQDGQGWIHARVLDGVRQNIGKMLQHNAPVNSAVGTAEGAAYGPLKAKITNAVERAVPGYRGNLASYASHSQPINDMQAGRALLDAIDSGGRDAGSNQTVNLSLVKQMLAKDNRANFPMSPQARQ